MEDQKKTSLREAAALLRGAHTGTLSVLDADTGGPYGSLINVAVDEAARPLLLISELSRHTQALRKDPRASVMVHAELPKTADPLTEMRVTVTGHFEPVDGAAVKQRYLASHPYAEGYAGFRDFSFWRMSPQKLYVVAGFGRIFAYDFEELKEVS